MDICKSAVMLMAIIGVACLTPGFAMEGESPAHNPVMGKELHSSSPTPTALYKNVEGKLKEIQGDMLILEGAESDQPIQVRVGKDTAFPNGKKEPGQSVHALVSAQDGHALIVR